MTRFADITCPREPIGLRREEAARYVGISAATFDRLVEKGTLPGARELGSLKVWSARELDEAFHNLPMAGRLRELSPSDHADAAGPYADPRV